MRKLGFVLFISILASSCVSASRFSGTASQRLGQIADAFTESSDNEGGAEEEPRTGMRLESLRVELARIDPHDPTLSESDRLDHAALTHELIAGGELARFPEELMPVTSLHGFQLRAPVEIAQAAESSTERALKILERLPARIASVRSRMESGLQRKVVPAKLAMAEVSRQVRALADADPTSNPLLLPFISRDEASRSRAVRTLQERVVPVIQDFLRFLESEYFPACRDEIAWSALPDGERWYRALLRYETSSELEPAKIHEIGLEETARLRSEIAKLTRKMGFKDGLPEFLKKAGARKDAYPPSPEATLAEYSRHLKRAQEFARRNFNRLPNEPIQVRTASTAHGVLNLVYRSGFFVIRSQDPKSHPRWEMESATIHETLPGHHLQLALARESSGISRIRKGARFAAFVEGWAQYAEILAAELGYFSDDPSRLGQLIYEIDRATRLVVDTGIHFQGWSEERARRYLLENTGRQWVQRYVVWPGQGAAYKLGQLRITGLREKARAELKSCFELRSFHDAVLGVGSVPLAALDPLIQRWVEEEKARCAKL